MKKSKNAINGFKQPLTAEEKHRLIADCTHDWEYWRNEEGKFEYVSPSCERITGYSREEFIEDPGLFLRIIHPEDRDRVYNHCKIEFDSDLFNTIEFRITRRDGRTCWIGHVCRPVFDDMGNFRGRRGSNRDITENKRSKEALRRNELVLQAELDAARRLQEISTQLIQTDGTEALYDKILDTATAIMDADAVSLHILHSEPAAGRKLRLFGYRGLSAQAATSWKWVPSDSRSSFGMVLRTGQRACIPDVLRSEALTESDDDLVVYLQSGIRAVQTTPLISRSGILLGMLSTHWQKPHEPTASELRSLDVLARLTADLIDRNQAEQTIKDSEKQVRNLMAILPVAVYTCDANGLITYYNEQAARIWGRSPQPEDTNERFCGSLRLYSPDGIPVPHNQTPMATVLRNGTRIRAREGIIERPDGSRVHVSVNIDPFHDRAGQISGAVNVITDITERKRTEEATRKAEALANDRYMELEQIYRALQKSESRMRTLAAVVENSNDFIGLATPDVKPFYINEAGRRMVGLDSPEAVLQTKFKDYFWPEDIAIVKNEAIPMFLKEGSWVGEVRFRNFKTGEPICTRWSAFAIRDEAGEVVAWATISTDLTHVKQAEEALRRSESQFRQLADVMPQLVWITNPDGYHEYLNRRWFEYTGTTLEDTRNEMLAGFLHPDDYQRTMERWRHSLNTGEPYKIEYRIRRAEDGAYRWFLGRALPVRNEHGEIVRWFGTCTEIHDIVETEEELRQTYHKLQTILDMAPAGILVADDTGRIVMSSAFTERIFGGPITGDAHGPHDGYHVFTNEGEPIPRGSLPLSLALKGETVSDNEILIKRMDGAQAVILTSATPLKTRSGKNWGAVAVFQDITERKQAEERLRTTLESIGDGFFAYDDQWRFIFINPVSERLLGINREEILGKNQWEVFPLTIGTQLETEFRRAAAGEIRDFEFYYEPWGRWFHNRCFPREGGGMSVYLRDITELKQTEEQLRQAQKMEAIGRLAGGVAHEFNNMLNVIIGYSDILISRLESESALKHYVSEIQEAAQRSAKMTGQLLAYSRKQMVRPQVIDLNGIIQNQISLLDRLIGETVDIRFFPSDPLWPVLMDPSQVDQILANLAVNARDASTGTGKVIITTKNKRITSDNASRNLLPGDYVCLTFSDNGCGMDEKTLERVFEPYFTTKAVGKGTGLGMATVYGIVKQNDGYIFAESILGKGSTFTLYFPRSEADAKTGDKIDDPDARAKGETILVVEDEVQVLNLAEILLKEAGYRVLKAKNPGEAIDSVRKNRDRIDLLLTDVIMPEMNGRALREQIEAICPGIRTIFMSGYTEDMIAEKNLGGDAADLIRKPFSAESLTRKVREILDR